MKRYEKFVLEAEKGITFEVAEGTSGELVIRALNIATANDHYANYANPPIPEGYKHVCGEWNNGIVSKHKQKERTLRFQSLSFFVLIFDRNEYKLYLIE